MAAGCSGLVAPAIFNAYFELPIGLFLCALLVVAVLWRELRPVWRGLLLAARDPETGRGFSDVELCDNVVTFIGAGHETTAKLVANGAVALTWFPEQRKELAADPSLLTQPARAILKALDQAGKSVSDVSLFELNEAFAAVGIASMRDLGITDEITNVNGGAIALGHPIGMSGNRLALTILHELRRRGGGTGAVALCGGAPHIRTHTW